MTNTHEPAVSLADDIRAVRAWGEFRSDVPWPSLDRILTALEELTSAPAPAVSRDALASGVLQDATELKADGWDEGKNAQIRHVEEWVALQLPGSVDGGYEPLVNPYRGGRA